MVGGTGARALVLGCATVDRLVLLLVLMMSQAVLAVSSAVQAGPAALPGQLAQDNRLFAGQQHGCTIQAQLYRHHCIARG